MKGEAYWRMVGTADELLASILAGAASITKPEDQLRRTTRDLRTRVANWTEGGVDFGTFIVSCNKSVIEISSLNEN